MISAEERNQIIEYDNNWKNYTSTISVVVISYKFRSNCILKHPENISDKLKAKTENTMESFLVN